MRRLPLVKKVYLEAFMTVFQPFLCPQFFLLFGMMVLYTNDPQVNFDKTSTHSFIYFLTFILFFALKVCSGYNWYKMNIWAALLPVLKRFSVLESFVVRDFGSIYHW